MLRRIDGLAADGARVDESRTVGGKEGLMVGTDGAAEGFLVGAHDLDGEIEGDLVGLAVLGARVDGREVVGAFVTEGAAVGRLETTEHVYEPAEGEVTQKSTRVFAAPDVPHIDQVLVLSRRGSRPDETSNV